MSVLNNSNDDVVECPLCMEPLEVDDLNFYPCTCGYQICRFCWHRIRTDENELCPACRKAYPENPADFKPLSQEQISALKAEKRQRDQQRKQKISENRKHLANVRVVQKNLVFVVGLPPRLADAEILKKHEYFGKYGKIHKVVINPSTTYAGVQGPSASAYVTYCSNNDALRAIQSVNNIMIDGRLIKTSLGTTKYCSHFMKNQQCPKPDCMYLHDLGDLEASFTKEEMHQGKHQEYEKRLHDALIAQTATANNTTSTNNNNNSPSGKLSESNKQASENLTQNGPEKTKEAWPSLSISPTNKDSGKTSKSNNNKENGGKKTKAEKTKNKKASTNSTSSSSSNSTNANSTSSITSMNGKDSNESSASTKDAGFNITKNSSSGEPTKHAMSADEELNLLSEIENDGSSNDLDGKADTPSLSLSTSGDSGTISDSVSGKSSPANFSDHAAENNHLTQQDVDKQQNKTNLEKNSFENFGTSVSSAEINTNCLPLTSSISGNVIDTTARFSKLGLFDDNNSFFSSNTFQPSPFFKIESSQTAQLRSLESSNQTNSPQLPDLLSGTELDKERQDLHEKLNLLKGLSDYNNPNNLQNGFVGLDGLQKRRNMMNGLNLNSGGLIEDGTLDFFGGGNEQSRFNPITQQTQNLHNQRTQQQQPQLQNSLHQNDSLNHQVYANSLSKFFDFHKNQQQQQQQQQFATPPPPQQQQLFMSDQISMPNLMDNSRLIDARRLNSQYLDHQNTSNSLLGSQIQKQRLANTQLGLNASPVQQQSLNNLNLFHTSNNTQNSRLQSYFQQQQQLQQQQQQQQQQSSQSTSIDDELDFDPFFETQKGLAELIENEQQQTQSNQQSKILDNSAQRCRLPPPGFSHMTHMNAFGLGLPRAATQSSTSKILPFMGNSGNVSQSQHNWPHHTGQQNLNYGVHDQMSNLLTKSNHQANKSFGSTSDWSLMDPAIVSFRPYQSFVSGPLQQSQNDMFLSTPHIAQQQISGQFDNSKLKSNEFSNRNNLIQSSYPGVPHGLNQQNGIMGQQQPTNSQQVNFNHSTSSWLSAEQSQNNLFMNHNISNGFSNNFDKFSIPPPPGFTLPKQKTECIN